MSITLYDLGPSLLPDHSLGLSTHVRKIVLILKYKNIPYTHKFLRISEIEPIAKSLGAPPTTTQTDGSPKYTVPILHDSTKGRAISDSLAIASYLDEAYPVTPVVIPSGTRVLQSLVADSFATNFNGLLAILRPRINQYMTPSFLEEIKKAYGEAVVSAEPTADEVKDGWVKAKKSFDELDKFFGEADEPYVMGNRPSYADFSLAAFLLTVRVYCGEDSQEWREVKGWASGRVGRICDGVFTIKA